MGRYIVKLSDSNGRSANVVYARKEHHHIVEYYDKKLLVGQECFNTQVEATKSAWNFIDGEDNGCNFNIFKR
jgi:hypothetical protein